MKNILKSATDVSLTSEDFLNPDYIYIPLKSNDSILKSMKDKVLKEEPLIKRGNDIIYSPISGTLHAINEEMLLENKQVTCLVLENDFKEKVYKKKGAIKYINEYSQKDLLSLIKKFNVCKLDEKETKILIVNGIDKDPQEKTYSFLIDSFHSKILETIDALVTILDINTTIFAVSNHDNGNVLKLTSHIGTYPNIKLKLLADVYPSGYKELIIKNTLSKNQIKEGFIYLTVEDVYNIYNVLKRRKPITEKYITLTGNSIETKKVLNVKIGTNISDIINSCCEITDDKYFVITNGLISGKTLISSNQPLTNEIKSIFLNTESQDVEKKCINCGLCNTKCPVGLNPKYIKEHKNADTSKCLNCGLCTYICPSKINFKPYLKGGYDE